MVTTVKVGGLGTLRHVRCVGSTSPGVRGEIEWSRTISAVKRMVNITSMMINISLTAGQPEQSMPSDRIF